MAETQNSIQVLSNLRKAYEEEDDLADGAMQFKIKNLKFKIHGVMQFITQNS